MIPIFLDPRVARTALVGRGVLAERRLHWLRAGGANPNVFSDAPSAALSDAATGALIARLPTSQDFAAIDVLWIADLPIDEASLLYALATTAKVLVNVEDVLTHCAFHTPAVVRRGRLMLAVGTGGASPAIASEVRARLETAFPESWSDALEDIAAERKQLQDNGADHATLKAHALASLKRHGL